MNFQQLGRISGTQQAASTPSRSGVVLPQVFGALFALIMALISVRSHFSRESRSDGGSSGELRLRSRIGLLSWLSAELAMSTCYRLRSFWSPDALFAMAGLYFFTRMRGIRVLLKPVSLCAAKNSCAWRRSCSAESRLLRRCGTGLPAVRCWNERNQARRPVPRGRRIKPVAACRSVPHGSKHPRAPASTKPISPGAVLTRNRSHSPPILRSAKCPPGRHENVRTPSFSGRKSWRLSVSQNARISNLLFVPAFLSLRVSRLTHAILLLHGQHLQGSFA